MYNLGKAKEQQRASSPFGGGVIPEDTYKLCARIKPGGYGPERLLKVSSSGFTALLVLEYTVVDGKYAGKKFTDWITVEFDEDQSLGGIEPEKKEGFEQAVMIGQAKLCDMLESAYCLDPDDKSDETETIRNPQSLRVFDGLVFLAKVKIKPAQNGYNESNAISWIVTPSSRGYYDPRPGKANAALPPPPFDDDIPY